MVAARLTARRPDPCSATAFAPPEIGPDCQGQVGNRRTAWMKLPA
jgi:hypothetical protein